MEKGRTIVRPFFFARQVATSPALPAIFLVQIDRISKKGEPAKGAGAQAATISH